MDDVVTGADAKVKARDAFEGLLKDELKSTRTTWDDFRKKWKKDRRFFGFGRDDKEREKVFKEWRASLGESESSLLSTHVITGTDKSDAIGKREEAKLAESGFLALLREHEQVIANNAKDGANPAWKDVGL